MKSLTHASLFVLSSVLLASAFPNSYYLYDGDNEAYSFIEEYKSDDTRPSFLYDAADGPRIVEFYSPWCA